MMLKHVNSGLLRILSANSNPSIPACVHQSGSAERDGRTGQADSICRSASKATPAVVGRIPILRRSDPRSSG